MKVRSAAVWVFSTLLLGGGEFAAAQPPAWEIKVEVMPDEVDHGMGWSIDVSGDTLIAGSWKERQWLYNETLGYSVQEDVHPGAAYVFVRTDPSSNLGWEQQGDPLVVDDEEGGFYIGYRVAIDGDTALISATQSDTNVARLFVFERTDGVWEQKKMLHMDGVDYYHEILRIDIDGNTAVLGQPKNYVQNITTGEWLPSHGQVFVYTKSIDGTWSDEPQVLVASDKANGDFFGDAVAVSGSRILIGASEREVFTLNGDGTCCNDTYTTTQRGKAYIFVNNVGAWEQDGDALQPDEEATDPRFHFGAYVALDGNSALIGHDSEYWTSCNDENPYENLLVYGFSFSGGSWEQTIKLKPSLIGEGSTDSNGLHGFGRGVELQGNRALIWGDFYNAVLFENWQHVDTQGSFGPIDSNCQRCGNLALSSDAIFLGAKSREEWGGTNGRVFLVDNHSVLPAGTDEITIFTSYVAPTPYGPLIGYRITTGYGRKFDFQLLQKDCSSKITDGSLIFDIYGKNYYRWRASMTENGYGLHITSNPELIESNSIYNQKTGKVEVCATVLLDSVVKYQEVLEIQHTFLGAFTFLQSSTSGNSIHTAYVVHKDRLGDFRAALLQKDCKSAIIDTQVNVELNSKWDDYSWDENYNYTDFKYTLDPETARNSVIFNAATSSIEVCHVVWLGSSKKRSKQKITIDVPEPGTFGGMFGDPHIVTFDGLQYDCQAAGEFTTLTSLEDPTFKIQERFTAVDTNSCGQASVSTGVAFRDANKPVIQISTPRAGGTSLNDVNGCPIDLYVDGDAQYLSGINLTSSNIDIIEEGDRVRIKHTDTYATLDVVVRSSDSFGCHIMVQVALPGSFRAGETLLGLLGTPNEDMTDDWRSSTGEVLTAPATDAESLFSNAYSYCVENWCVGDSADSLFTYGTGESFQDINHCDVPFSTEVEDAVLDLVDTPSLKQELADACGGSLICLVDGVCGSITDAVEALDNEQVIVETQVEVKAAIFPREQMEVADVVEVPEQENETETAEQETTDAFWYPAWDKGSTESGCLNDGQASTHMKKSGLFFSVSREACCGRFFNWDKATCLGEAEATPPGFYPNWGYPEEKCLNSTAQIGQENSLPDYMMNNPQQWMYDDIESCCKKYYPWDVNSCIVESGGTVTIEYTNKWYVNQEEQICQQDCLEDPSSPTCGGAVESWNGLYGSVEACCTHKLYWVSPSTCVQQSALQSVTGTEKWYVDWILQKCVKDCDSGEGCGGLAMTFNTLYEDVDICCSMIFWKDRSECL